MDLILKIHDTNAGRLQKAFQTLGCLVRKHGINAQIVAVSEQLEHCRLGISNQLPAIELSGYILGKGFELTEERLEDLCVRVVAATKQVP